MNNNDEEIKKNLAGYRKKYYYKNREKLLANRKESYKKDKEKILAYAKKYYEKNREKVILKNKIYIQKLHAWGLEHRNFCLKNSAQNGGRKDLPSENAEKNN